MTTSPKRILFIARELTEGGAAFLALRHLKRLLKISREIDFLITGPVSAALSAQLDGISIHTSCVGMDARVSNNLAPRQAYINEYPCLSRQYDIVIGSSLFPDRAACIAFSASRGQRKLLVLLDEGLIIPNHEGEIKAAMQCAIVAADHLLPVSQSLLNKLAQSYPVLNEIPRTVIFPPIETEKDAPTSPFANFVGDGLTHVVTAARLDPVKQISTCLRAHHELRQEGTDFHWHIVGDGPERETLQSEIIRLDMVDRFHLEGFQTNPRPWMQYADLFVLASRSEGCPTVIREAIAAGTPVLSTDVNGVRELIDDGNTGIVLADCAADLKENLRRLLTHREVRERLRLNISRLPAGPDGYETNQMIDLFDGDPRNRPIPRVTILIPTYDHGDLIHRAVESGLMQDYPSLEVVVCDDASNDQTESVVRRYLHDPRLTYVRRTSNTGRIANYRKGLEINARGIWVLLLDGDDYLIDPSFISQCMDTLEENKAANPLFLQAGHRVTWNTINHLPVDILPDIETESAVMTGADYLSLVFRTGFFTHLGTLYSRVAALEQGFYSKNISSSDMDSLLRLATKGNVILMKKIAGVWLQHGSNASSNVPLGQIKENVQIFREILKEVPGKNTVDFKKMDAELTDYEARSLRHLFSTTIDKSATGLIDSLKMLTIMMQINPRVFLNKDLRTAWQGWAKHLTYMSSRYLAVSVKRIITRYLRRQ